jgi:cob(I)alamin adenosyltransferase
MSRYKIYTKKGDDGTTGLLSGKRVRKHHIRIKAYGTVDELNAWVGMIRNFKIDKYTENYLIKIQNELMIVSSQLADDTADEISKSYKKLEPIVTNKPLKIWKIKSI